MTDLIDLQSAYIRQSRDVEDNAWIVFNTKSEEIGKLSSTLNPKEAMSYLHFARPFELAAFNKGIQFGKDEAKRFYENRLTKANEYIEAVNAENERLSMKILQMIEGDAD